MGILMLVESTIDGIVLSRLETNTFVLEFLQCCHSGSGIKNSIDDFILAFVFIALSRDPIHWTSECLETLEKRTILSSVGGLEPSERQGRPATLEHVGDAWVILMSART